MGKSKIKREPNPRQAQAAARARRLRGAVLSLLAEETPERLNADVLLGVLERLHYDVTARELAAAVAYLGSRGYVEYEELRSRELPGLPRLVRVGITAQGADLVDATCDDPGVDLP
ncbi:hypothetical protein MYX77_04220 [Acidobacteriia bacterium AH_259_A11_L15]|nr:hypothetical protein [Acidobacteriia bacterium AH_259_A11_L15]